MLTGISSDGHLVFDDLLDDQGRAVVSAAAHLLSDGTSYFAIGAPPPPTQQATGLTLDGHVVYDDALDDQGRKVTAVATPGFLGMLVDGMQYVTFTQGSAATFSTSLADALTLSEAFAKQVNAAEADTIGFVETFRRDTAKSIGDSLGLSETERMAVSKTLAESVSLTESLTARLVIVRGFAESVSLTEGLAGGAVLPPLTEPFDLTEAQTRQVQKTFAEAVALNETMRVVTGRRLTESVALTENLTAIAVKLKALADTVVFTESFSKRVIRSIAESVSLSEQLGLQPSTGGSQFQQGVSDAVLLTEQMLKQLGKPTADAVALSETITRDLRKTINEQFALTENVQMTLVKILGFAETADLTEQLVIQIIQNLFLRKYRGTVVITKHWQRQATITTKFAGQVVL